MPYKILVVDDELDLELLITQKFRRKIREGEFQFYFAHNGFEALQKINEDPDIDMMMTDINMPEMDGLTLLGKLGQLEGQMLKAIVVSAYGDMDNIRVAMNRGAFDFLTKPMNFEDLEITLQKTLEQVRQLKDAVKDKKTLTSIQRDLDIASRIQLSILPSAQNPFPDKKELSLAANMIAAKNVGGDFYDFFMIDENRLGFAIADVSGKGIPAALFMAVSRTTLKATALQGASAGEVLGVVNDLLCAENVSTLFVTVIYGILNIKTGEVEYANGGHNLPYILRNNGQIELIPKSGGMGLAIMEEMPFQTCKTTLMPGDSFFLYTDGVPEAMNIAGELYGDERLLSVLQAQNKPGMELNALVQGVIADVRQHAGPAEQSDDITILTLRYNG
jgi:sigma-B regulation protein RsbU (phosphoserine phosphatase)